MSGPKNKCSRFLDMLLVLIVSIPSHVISSRFLVGSGAAYRFFRWLSVILPFVIDSSYISYYIHPFRDNDELHNGSKHFRTSFSRSHQVTAYSARGHHHLL